MDEILNTYYSNNGRKLCNVVDRILHKFGGLSQKDYGDFYSLADEIFARIIREDTYDKEKGSFDGYLSSCLTNKITAAIRDRNRMKRSNTRVKRDDDGNITYEFMPDISIDTPIDEAGGTIKDMIMSDFNIDNELSESGIMLLSENMETYLDSLSDTQKEIAKLVIAGYSHSEIKNILGLSDARFTMFIKDMGSFEKSQILKYNNETQDEEEITMGNNNSQTLEKSKGDRLSIVSLIKKMNNQTIRFNHPLQRPSDQWTSVMKGNLVSDILQGNPIPPLVFAEQVMNELAIIWDLDGKQRSTNVASFKNDMFKISKNVRRWDISYQSIIKDENGNPILDTDGFPQAELKHFDIRGKKFSSLPEELQDKFLDYNFEIVQYINCSSEDIAYHIARYNEGKPMSVSHKGIVRLGEEFASIVKSISVMPFFKEKGGYTVNEAKGTNGVLNRVVIESVMASNFLNDWKSDQGDMCEYLKDNATIEMFEEFEDIVDRISASGNDETFNMFDSKESFIYFTLFSRFIKFGLPDLKFVEFMNNLPLILEDKQVGGITYESLCVDKEKGKSKSNKDKSVATGKIEFLYTTMLDYLGLSEKADVYESEYDCDNVRDITEFISEMVSNDISDSDVDCYNETLSLLLEERVKYGSKLYDNQNKLPLLAMVAYSYHKDVDIDDWIEDFDGRNNTYPTNQRENYTYMKNDFIEFSKKVERKTA